MERQERYYVNHGCGHDGLLRCKDCRSLVTFEYLQQYGCCKCGSHKVTEITSMSLWEWFKVWTGIIDFPMRKEFLNEFFRS